MKKLLLCAFAAIVALASCTKDPVQSNGPRKIGKQVTYGFSVGYDDVLARYDMESGGMKNVDPEKFFLRYILELYQNDGVTFASRHERLVDFTGGSTTQFNLKIPTDKYKVAIWADFVPRNGREASPIGGVDYALDQDELTANDYFYDTNFKDEGLRNVNIKPEMFNAKNASFYDGGRRMSRDAYCGTTSIDLINEVTLTGNVQLRRALGRVAVYARNMDADRLATAGYAVPDSVVVTYPADTYYSNYNVVTGLPFTDAAWDADLVYSHSLTPKDNPVEAAGKLGNQTFTDLQLMTFDYLFPTVDGNKTTFKVQYFADGTEIAGIETLVEGRTIVKNKQQRLVADIYDNDHQFVAAVKDADGKVIPATQGKLFDAATALEEAFAMLPATGGTIKLYTGNFKSTGITVNKNLIIEGIEGKSVIYGENAIAQTTSVGSYYGQNPILFIEGSDDQSAPIEVSIKGVNFTIKNTPGPGGADGLTIDKNALVTLKHVVFDGINNFNGNTYKPSDNQQGRCVTVLEGGILSADSCTFKMFNKNAVDVFEGGKADMANCTVTGDKYNAQTVYNNTAGDASAKLAAAYGGHAIQSGFTFRTGASGSVAGCKFSDLTFNLDKGLRMEKYDQARAVYLYEPGTTTVIVGETDPTNIYTNCELNWNAWTSTPPSDDATLSGIKVNNVSLTGFDPAQLTYSVNVGRDVANATVTAETTDFYANKVIDPSVATALEVGVPKDFTIIVTSEDGANELEYVVTVTRVPSTDATLSDLKLNGATVSGFNASKLEYDVTVLNNVPTATVTATAKHAQANAVVDPATEQSLTVGVAVPFTVTVTAEDGTTQQTYTVNVTRAASTDATLSDLQVNGATVMNFNASTLEYNIVLESDKTTAVVTATKTSDVATMVINPDTEVALTPLVKVTFTVTVTAQDGATTKVYTVNVTRDKTDNSALSDLKLGGTTVVGFAKTTLTYNVDVPNTQTTAVVTATADDSRSVVVIAPSGSTELTPGVAMPFTVTVTAKDGVTTSVYTVNVTRALSANSQLSDLQLNAATVANFAAGTLTYNVSVPFATTTATITGVAADAAAGATVSVSPAEATALTPGTPQAFTVTVTAANSTTTVYTVNVTREAEVIVP